VTAKGQKETEPVCDCNYLACVIATRSYVWFAKKRKPDFDCVVEKNKNTDEARKLNFKKTILLTMPDCNSEKNMIATTVCTQLQKKAMK
jgi:hypothetical protein